MNPHDRIIRCEHRTSLWCCVALLMMLAAIACCWATLWAAIMQLALPAVAAAMAAVAFWFARGRALQSARFWEDRRLREMQWHADEHRL